MATPRRDLSQMLAAAPGSIFTRLALTPQPWMGDANCAGTDPESFFPEKGGSTREAKKVCARCLVSAECLDWALELEERFGIYGGLSERERRRLAKTLRTAAEVAS